MEIIGSMSLCLHKCHCPDLEDFVQLIIIPVNEYNLKICLFTHIFFLKDVLTGRLCYYPLRLLSIEGIEVKGKRALVIGRSKIVGMPMANLLTWHHATVTIAHSRTVNMEQLVGEADILVVATGQTEMVKGAWVKQGAVVIDCGINSVPGNYEFSLVSLFCNFVSSFGPREVHG